MEEIHIREHQSLSVVTEIKVNNQRLFTKKTHFLQEKETLQVHSSRIQLEITEASRTVLELHT